MKKANDNNHNSKCFPSEFENSALKRINLALRWLVRNDGIVDLGVWTFIQPSRLYIPLDIHVGNTARVLDILKRKINDRKAVEELTGKLRFLTETYGNIHFYFREDNNYLSTEKKLIKRIQPK